MATSGLIEAAQLEAARALSRILTQRGINHAFIGGFALRLLESPRPTEDIDAMIDVTDPGLKLYFTTDDDRGIKVTVETLGIGTLGLPCRIAMLRPKDDIPILEPRVLILTKIKRWVMISESTRPKSIDKAISDMEDIRYLLGWLAKHCQKIDFPMYEAAQPGRLLVAVRQLGRFLERTGEKETLELLVSVLTEEDRAKVMDA